MPTPTKHQSRRIVAEFTRHPWAILPEKFDEMAELVELRRQGETFTPEEVAARLGLEYDAAGPWDNQAAERKPYAIRQGVAVLGLYGVLAPRMNLLMRFSGGTSTKQFGDDLAAALADPDVRAALIEIDSPGGSALGLEELVGRIETLAASTDKPIWGLVDGMAASGAYYVGSALDRLAATPSSLVGSIGVIMIHSERSRAEAAAGITNTIIKSAPKKGTGNAYEPLTAEARATLQGTSDDYYRLFVDAVARGRGVTAERVVADFGQGATLIASRALAAGMVDQVALAEEVFADLLETIRPAGSTGSGRAAIDPGATTTTRNTGAQTTPTAVSTAATAAGGPDSLSHPPALQEGDTMEEHENTTTPAAQAAAPPATPPAAHQPTNPPTAPPDPAADERRRAEEARIRAEERQRCATLRARGEVLGIPQAEIEAAVENGTEVPDALEAWTASLSRREAPVQGRADISVVGSAADRFGALATEAVVARCDPTAEADLSPEARQVQRMPLVEMARVQLEQAGRPLGRYATHQDIAEAWLKMGGAEHRNVTPGAVDSSTSGDFPHLLSGWGNALLDRSFIKSTAKFRLWCKRLDDLADFSAREIIGIGGIAELHEVADGQPIPEAKMAEEALGFIKAGQYADKVSLTTGMIVGDRLGAFADTLLALGVAAERTLNNLAIGLIAGNPTLLDGYALFIDANHGNYVGSGSGAAPSVAQLQLMRQRHRLQTGPGGADVVDIPPRYLLAPATLEKSTDQVLGGFDYYPATDANVNPFRRSMEPIIDAALDGNSTSMWYTVADPMLRPAIVYAYLRGYGPTGRRETWYDPDTKRRCFSLEYHCAAAVGSYRGIVKNYGA